MVSASTDEVTERSKWTRLQQASLLTLPIVLIGAVALWLMFFMFVYDVYVTSFGSTSYFDYVAQVRLGEAVRYTWSIILTRNTVGLSLLAFMLSSPFIFLLLCLWMLKGGRSLSRKVLYLLRIRSMVSLIAQTVLVLISAYGMVIVYGLAFYLVATRAGEYVQIAAYYSDHLAAMYQAPFGSSAGAGLYHGPSRQTVFATLAGLVAASALIGVPIGAVVRKHQRMIMGKARLATLRDAADFRLRDKHGIVLGLKQGLLLRNDGDQHVMLIGSPGQGKSRGFAIPTMMSFQGSQVVLDMSGELYEETSGYLRHKGYETFLLAPGSEFTDGYNPLDLISNDPNQRITDLQKLTQMLLPERLRSDSSDFWEESARILLTALLGFVLECPDTRKSLSELYRILNSMSDERKAIVQLLENYEHVLSDQTRMQLTKFAGRHEKLGEGIAAEIVAKLNFLQNPLVEALTSFTSIPVDSIRKRKIAIYIQADWNAMQVYERLLSMFIQQMADKLVHMGRLRNGEHEVLMMLDEFGNSGRIDTVLTLAPLIRKNGVRFVFILQDGAQLERLYQRSGQKILMGTSTIKLYMNFQNQEDAMAVSMAAGKTTEWIEQSSYTYRHGRRQRSISKVPISVDLLPVNTLMMMKPEEAILQVTGMPLMRIMKLDAGGEQMFSGVQKFKMVTKPRLKPVEWTIADIDASEVDGVMATKRAAQNGQEDAQTEENEASLEATDRSRKRQSSGYIVKDGVRPVFISSLDELRRRLDLDEKRAAGVTEEELQQQEKRSAGRKPSRSSGRKEVPDEAKDHHNDGDDDFAIDEELLKREAFSGALGQRRDQYGSPADLMDGAIEHSPRSTVLQRQEVKEAFGNDLQSLNEAIFQQAGALQLEPSELNPDVELLIDTLSARLSEENSRAILQEFADLAREPLRENSE